MKKRDDERGRGPDGPQTLERPASPQTLEPFSADDLLRELKAREAESIPSEGYGPRTTRPTPSEALRDVDSESIATALKAKQKVIYGTDDRVDMFQVTDTAIMADADSVVALFAAGDVVDNGNGTSTLQTENFGTARNLCNNEPFRNQPIGANCSGFLVAPDIIATAGHCLDATNVTTWRFVFGFRMQNATTAQTVINNTEIYRGVGVIGRQETNTADWALVRIDRAVTNHRIARIRRAGRIADNQAVHVIGHPVGLPTKFAPNARVRDNSPAAFFVANLDTYGGNSGSPVFNSTDHVVEGVLVRGETDFAMQGTCRVSLVCPDTGCRGEDSTRTTEFAAQVPAAGPGPSPRLPGLAQISAVSRGADHLDVFLTDANGVIWTAAWEPAFTDGWHGWWELKAGRAAAGAPVHAVSRSNHKLDVFVIGTDNHVYTAAWEPAFTDWWHGWWGLAGGVAAPGAHVTVVSRSRDKLDVFVVGTDGRVYTAAWEPGFTDGWHGWWPIGNIRVPAGAPVHAVSRSKDKLDIFVTDVNGVIRTAAWEPAFADGWHGWWELQGGRAVPGAAVTAVSRNTDKLDVFVVGTDGSIYTAAWEPTFADGWHGWWRIGNVQAPGRAPVHAVSRSADKLDIFVTDANGVVKTAAWEPAFTDGWHGWWELNGGRATPGAPVYAVSRSPDKLDVFVVGTNGRVFTAAWEPSFPDGWHGWWQIGA